MKKHIPNIFTIFNLILGWVAIYFAFNLSFQLSIYSILLASIFDYFDGFTARKLEVESKLGAQLDSLADFITFGIAPATIIFNFSISKEIFLNSNLEFWIFVFIGLIPVFASLRLAKFNSTINTQNFFIGLPSPAFALLAVAITLILIEYKLDNYNIYYPFIMVGLSSLMVLKVKFLSFKLKNFTIIDNKLISSFALLSLVSFFILIIMGIPIFILPIILFLYLLFSVIFNFLK
jgi:CDP-diacylglycerol--serine O-phosphatidyltransferase|tara:strand:+ start:245 stop:946 length:702 start_codon:yes stop_codon:yes gene_type:complete